MRAGPDRQRRVAPAAGQPTFAAFAGTLVTAPPAGAHPATPGPAADRSDRRAGPDLFRLRKELTYGAVRGIVVDQPGGRECMGEMGCVSRLSQLLDSLPGVEHGEFVTASRLIRFVRTAQGAVAVDVVPGSDLAADLDTVLPLPAGPTGMHRGEVVR